MLAGTHGRIGILLSVTTPTPTSPDNQLDAASTNSSAGLTRFGFFVSTLEELKLVVWPSRQQIISEAVVVMAIVGLSTLAIAAVDNFYGWGSQQVFL
uniref:Preprotein translocase subunit SecE n=1 Tax=Paulinella chromatophora TaxID=39717 RepID=B1X4D1_PAUCH|nr:Preprotein translocase subunit SecE [Paulinella chromatophora]ACB42800.1 Preprotein translocase subunit SecE [Paulinella chromatophora]